MPLQPLTLNLVEGSVTFAFSPEIARELQQELHTLQGYLKANAAQALAGSSSGKPVPHPVLDYCQTGEVRLEVFCNPNIWPNPYAAKVLITLRDEQIKLTTEAELSRVAEDLNQYLEQFG